MVAHREAAPVEVGVALHVGCQQILAHVLAIGDGFRPGPNHEDGPVRTGQDAKTAEHRLTPLAGARAGPLSQELAQRGTHVEKLPSRQLHPRQNCFGFVES